MDLHVIAGDEARAQTSFVILIASTIPVIAKAMRLAWRYRWRPGAGQRGILQGLNGPKGRRSESCDPPTEALSP